MSSMYFTGTPDWVNFSIPSIVFWGAWEFLAIRYSHVDWPLQVKLLLNSWAMKKTLVVEGIWEIKLPSYVGIIS